MDHFLSHLILSGVNVGWWSWNLLPFLQPRLSSIHFKIIIGKILWSRLIISIAIPYYLLLFLNYLLWFIGGILDLTHWNIDWSLIFVGPLFCLSISIFQFVQCFFITSIGLFFRLASLLFPAFFNICFVEIMSVTNVISLLIIFTGVWIFYIVWLVFLLLIWFVSFEFVQIIV